MPDSAQEAIDSFHRWNDSWNEGDVEKQILEMHFPHIRLDGQNSFARIETADDFRASQPAIKADWKKRIGTILRLCLSVQLKLDPKRFI